MLQRDALQRQARLANLAFAYWHLSQLVSRIARARLRGEVHLQPVEPEAGRYWPVLTAREGSQSVIEEHFSDENLMELSDLLGFVTGKSEADAIFRLEEMATQYLAPLRQQLEQAGVEVDREVPQYAAPGQGEQRPNQPRSD
jgi:nucleotide-binding universal stress UspA family protein